MYARRDSYDSCVRRIFTARVGKNCDVVTLVLKHTRLFKDPDMASVVCEKPCWRDLNDMTTHGTVLPYIRNPRSGRSAGGGSILGLTVGSSNDHGR